MASSFWRLRFFDYLLGGFLNFLFGLLEFLFGFLIFRLLGIFWIPLPQETLVLPLASVLLYDALLSFGTKAENVLDNELIRRMFPAHQVTSAWVDNDLGSSIFKRSFRDPGTSTGRAGIHLSNAHKCAVVALHDVLFQRIVRIATIAHHLENSRLDVSYSKM